MCILVYSTQQMLIIDYFSTHCTLGWTVPLSYLLRAAFCPTYVTGPDALIEKVKLFFCWLNTDKHVETLLLPFIKHTNTHTHFSLLVWLEPDS